MTETKQWERPASVPIPTIWSRYEGKKPMPNGRVPKFRIQDFTEDLRDEVIHNMLTYFAADEPLSRCLNVKEDPATLDEFKALFSKFLDGKMALVALVENLDELGDKNLPVLAGCNMTKVFTVNEQTEDVQSPKLRKILHVLELLEEKRNCFQHYQVSEYLYAMGLSVNPVYRGNGLGTEILKARFPLCNAVGVKASVTVFTSAESQAAAQKAGFETLEEIVYNEYKNEKNEVIFKIDKPKSMKLMGIKYH